MLIPALDTGGKQIAWIDHLKLKEGSLFREGERVFRLNASSEAIESDLAAVSIWDDAPL